MLTLPTPILPQMIGHVAPAADDASRAALPGGSSVSLVAMLIAGETTREPSFSSFIVSGRKPPPRVGSLVQDAAMLPFSSPRTLYHGVLLPDKWVDATSACRLQANRKVL